MTWSSSVCRRNPRPRRFAAPLTVLLLLVAGTAAATPPQRSLATLRESWCDPRRPDETISFAMFIFVLSL